MEKEDQLIKELIREGLLKSAPEDFTEKVMHAVATTEIRKKSIFGDNVFSYAAITLTAIVLAGSIIYFVDPAFYSSGTGSFMNLLKQVTFSFSYLLSGSIKLNVFTGSSILIEGIIAIIVVLLIFDRLLGRYRRVTGLFV